MLPASLSAQLPSVLYYKMNENAGTSTANAANPGQGSNPVNLSANASWNAAGRFGSAISFTSVSGGGMSTGWIPNLPNTQSWTLEFYVNAPATSTQYMFGNGVSSQFRIFTTTTGGLTLTGSGFTNLTVSSGILDNTWHHVAYVFDGTAKTMTVYRDGTQVGQNTGQTTAALTSTAAFCVGGQGVTTTSAQCSLDEVRFWTTARTQAEIQANMNNELNANAPTLTPTGGSGFSAARVYTGSPGVALASADLSAGSPVASNIDITITPVSAAPGVTAPANQTGVAVPFTLSWTGTPTTAGSYSYTVALTDGTNSANYTVILNIVQPDINFVRGATTIPDGGSDTLTGTIVATVASSITYTIQNTGTGTLTITNPAAISGQSNCTVSITTQPTTSVAGATSTATVLSVTPIAAGAFSFNYALTNGVAAKNPYDFTVSGTAVAANPDLVFARGATAVADGGTDTLTNSFPVAAARTITYTLSNPGNVSTTLTGGATAVTPISNCSVSVTTAPATSIAVSGSTTTVITVTPTAVGTFSFAYSIGNNTASKNPYDFTVVGTAAAPLSGTYTINQTSGNFSSVGEAFDTLEFLGVSGPVTLTITDSATYTADSSYTLGINGSGTVAAVSGVSATNTITLRAATGQSPKIQGNATGAILQSPLTGRGALGIMTSFVTVEGLEVFGGPNFGIIIQGNNTTLNPVNNTIRRCKVRDIPDGPGIAFMGQNSAYATNILIENNFVWNCFTNSGNPTASTVLLNNTGGAITIRNAAQNSGIVRHNTILHTSSFGGTALNSTATAGIYAYSSSTTYALNEVSNNIVVCTNSTVAAIYLYSATSNPTPANCNFNCWNSTVFLARAGAAVAFATWQTEGRDANGTTANPQLVSTSSPFDLHLQTSSPCIEPSGQTSSLASDIDGDPRPLGRVADIGADEGIPSNMGPNITSGAPTAGYLGLSYNHTFTANGYPVTFTWSITSGSLPGGLSLNASTGVVSGTPLATGTFAFTINCGNGISPDASAATQIVINTPLPEINVQRAAVNIADGAVDFVAGFNTSTPGSLTYTIQNLGNANLNISNPSTFIGSQSGCAVTITTPPASILAPSGSTTFVLSIQPSAGVFSFAIALGNDDPNENPYDITVNGAANDTAGGAIALTLDREVDFSLTGYGNDYQIQAASTKFTGIGQTVTTAPGRDCAFSFTAPSAGNYSFRVHFGSTSNFTIYLLSTVPTGAAPITINDTDIIAASNRNTNTIGGGEELFSVALTASQLVYLIVDEVALSTGGVFSVEVTSTSNEVEPNDTPAQAMSNVFGRTVGTGVAGDADFIDLGTPATGSRVFAMIDTATSGSQDSTLRVTTTADTLEYDDDDGDVPFGNASGTSRSSCIAGTPTTGGQTFLRVTNFSATTTSEPYRVYVVVQPPSSSATVESEPNDTVGQANSATNNYFSGVILSSTDVDLYGFTVAVGDVVFVGLDLDPTRTNLPFNGALAILDSTGAVVFAVNDANATSSTTSGAGSLVATTPTSPGEGIVLRARAAGTYYARVTYSSGTAGRAYLLSISKNGNLGGGGIATAPTITSSAPANGVVGTAYSHTFTATGSPSTFTWSVSAGSLPPGLTLGASSGVLSGTPASSGNYGFTVMCDNGVAPNATQVVNMVVNQAPAVTSAAPADALLGAAYSHTFTASGFPATFTWSVTAGALPAGLTLNASSGVLSGTPTSNGSYGFTIGVSNGISPNASQVVNMNVNEPPTTTSAAPGGGNVGVSYSHTYTATGFPSAFTWTVTSGALPNGLTLNASTGLLSGTPTAAGTFNGVVTCSNGVSPNATQGFSISITAAPQAPAITSGAPANGLVGATYSHTFTASGNPTTFTWSVSAGSLPAGLSLNASSGVLSGTPTASGAFSFTVTCSNGVNPDANQPVSMNVNQPPTITSAAPGNGLVGSAYSHTFTATGFPASFTWSVSAGALPGGLSLNASSGVLSGSPSASGAFNFTVSCANGISPNATQVVNMNVNQAPAITSSAPANGLVGAAYSHTFTASGFPATFTWTVSSGSLPSGLSLNASSGVLSGTPSASGAFAFTVQCANGISPAASQVVNMNVNAAPSITSGAPANAPVNVAYTHTFSGTGFPATLTWSVSAGALPAGLTLGASSGVLSGTPTTTGTHNFTISCSNGISPDASQVVSMDVTLAPTITSAAPASGVVGSAYTHTFTATGFPSAFNWTVTVGTLPAGLTLNATTGVLSGTPTAAGASAFTVTCSNGVAPDATQPVNMQINQAPTITSVAPPNGATFTAYSHTCTATGTPATFTWSVSAGALPGGLTLNATTGAISGTPAAVGVFTGTISCSNGIAPDAAQAFNITVTATPAPNMNVLRGTTNVADGGSDALGNATITLPQSITYTITNNGSAALNLTGTPNVVVTGGAMNVTGLNVVAPATTSVAISASVTFTVQFVVPVTGAFSFTVSIDNNDPNTGKNPYNWTVNGTGVTAPEIDVMRGTTSVADGGSVTLSNLTAGFSSTFTFTINNTGNAPLSITTPITVGTFANCTATVTTQPNSTVAAGGSTSFTVSVLGGTAGAYSFNVSITNNDADENPYNFTANGTVVPPGGSMVGGGGSGGGGGGGCTTSSGESMWLMLASALLMLTLVVRLRRRAA